MTLLSPGDLMDAEVRMPGGQATDVGRADFARGGKPVSRGNRRRRLEFSRVDEYDSTDDAWLEVFRAMVADPWGVKATLRVTPRGGSAVDFPAAFLSTRHRMLGGDPVETMHEYVLRIGGAL